MDRIATESLDLNERVLGFLFSLFVFHSLELGREKKNYQLLEWRGSLGRPLSICFHSFCDGGSCKEVILARDALRFFSAYSTVAYQAPPPMVSRIPIMFVGVMTRLKMITARSIVRTCLTLAAKSGIRMRSTKNK